MKKETQDLLKAYETKILERRQIDVALEAMKDVLVQELDPAARVETDLGTFTVEARTKWKYSTGIKQREDALKEDKKTEEADGTAVPTLGDRFLVYREKKG